MRHQRRKTSLRKLFSNTRFVIWIICTPSNAPSLIQVDVKGDKKVRSLDFVTIKPQHVMTHDNTSAVIKKFDAIGATRVKNKRQIVFTLDHNIQVRNNLDLNLVSFHLPLPNRTTGSN